MSIDDMGYGAGGGFISGVLATILTALGINKRMEKLEKSVMYKDVFEQFEKRLDEKINKMDSKIDTLLTRRRQDRDKYE